MGSSREKVLLASIPGLREGWKPVTRSFLGAKGWSEVGDLVKRDTCLVQVDSDTVCSSAVDRLLELSVWQVLRSEEVPFRDLVAFSSVLRVGGIQVASSACFFLAMFVCCFELTIAMPMAAIVPLATTM